MAIFFLFHPRLRAAQPGRAPAGPWSPSHLAFCCALSDRITMLCFLTERATALFERSLAEFVPVSLCLVAPLGGFPEGVRAFGLAHPFPGDAVVFPAHCSPVNRWIWRWPDLQSRLGRSAAAPRPLALAGGPAPYSGDGGLKMRNLRLFAAVLGHILWHADLEYAGERADRSCWPWVGNLAGQPVPCSRCCFGQAASTGGWSGKEALGSRPLHPA